MPPVAKRTPQERLVELLQPEVDVPAKVSGHGYLDVLGHDAPPARTLAQRLMRTRIYSAAYQIGRPIGFRVAGGPKALSPAQDRAAITARLNLQPGATVIDIGCGPGNFTGWFGAQVSPGGLAIGVDASHTMLTRAVADNSGANVAYLCGDAEDLPFRDDVADSVSCLAALYLINQPFQAIAEISRILKPGGKVALMTSLAPGGVRNSFRATVLESLGGVRMFSRDEITTFLRDNGFNDIEQQTSGLMQRVVATLE